MAHDQIQKARNIAVNLLPGSGSITEDEIAQAVAQTMQLVPLADGEIEGLIRELQAAYTVSVDIAGTLDGKGDHQDWLADRRSQLDWNLWYRYFQYLQEVKQLPPPVANRLDDVTDQILQRLEDPKRPGSWDRRGMVVGHVQSGKTANYTGLICKAIDAGYKVIVVLAGMHDSLRSQTQLRLDEGVLGFDTQKRMVYDQGNSRIGVGLLPGAVLYPVHSFTSSAQKGDFKKTAAQTLGVNPGGNDPLVFVVKKHKSILNNLISWFTSFDAKVAEGGDHPVVHNIPLLVIDDECDNASVNTKIDDADLEPTAINACIRRLLLSFDQSSYIGYTATPFANIFITPESAAAEKHGDDIFPRDFIISLKKPSDYVGATRVFGLEADPELGLEEVEAYPITRTVEDNEEWVPWNHKPTFEITSPLPDSLRKALLSFVLVCAARRARVDGPHHNSMLVHVTRFTEVQKQVSEQIEEELGLIRQRIKYGDGARTDKVLEELEELWNQDFISTTEWFDDADLPAVSWAEVLDCLQQEISKIEVRTVNGRSAEALEYFDKPNGISVIAVGGAKLSRGLTLEGLSVSYYLRTSQMYDTLLQMGRWFGFRPGYLDLCRLFTTAELQTMYMETALAQEDLLLQLDEMALSGGTPNDFGLRVRGSANGLVATAAGKMRKGTKIKLTYSADVSETIMFETSAERLQGNLDATNRLVRRLDAISDASTKLPNRDDRTRLWSNIGGDVIVDFLGDYRTHPNATKAQAILMSKYIERRMGDSTPELTGWSVALISVKGDEAEIGGRKVGMTRRAHVPPSQSNPGDRYAIKRLLSPSDEAIDLTEAEMSEALRLTTQWWEYGTIKSKSDEPPKIPNGLAIRETRPPSRGLLLIYALDPDAAKMPILDEPICAFAISFPKSKDGQAGAIEYMVNPVYLQSELDPG